MKQADADSGIPVHIKVALSNWLTRICSMAMQLVSVPLLTRGLGDDGFAAYAITIALLSWYSLLDLGLGNALQNFISEMRNQERDFAPYIAAALLTSLLVLVFAVCALLLSSPYLSKFLLAKIHTIDADTKTRIILVSGLFFIANATGTICVKAMYATERGVLGNMLLFFANLSSFVALLAAMQWAPNAQLLQWAVAAYAAPLGVLGILLPVIFLKRYVGGSTRQKIPRHAQLTKVKQLLMRSRGFWWLALWGTAIYNVDYLIMSQALTANDIAVYTIFQRVFAAAMAFYSGLLNASWPHWAKCISKGDWESVTQSIRTYLIVAISISILVSLAATLLKTKIFELFLPSSDAVISTSLILLFGTYSVLRIWSDTFSVALLAASHTEVFLRYAPFQAVIGFVLQIWLATYFGLHGILLALILSLLLTAVWILPTHLGALVAGARKPISPIA